MADTELERLRAVYALVLDWGDIELRQRVRAIMAGDLAATRQAICGVVSLSGPNGEPLACGYPPDHLPAPHSWSALPTWTPPQG